MTKQNDIFAGENNMHTVYLAAIRAAERSMFVHGRASTGEPLALGDLADVRESLEMALQRIAELEAKVKSE